ncbi:ElyC/SanA/YdcF family protein [Marinomonas pollencensis]|uniref:Uncharacterized SAM-binding protein YcdF (DUF218 family) n=1 Tax=Marinomonas pollencensis TaxID=491954 RepID=A0A3E0DKL3_9GAMM|nr:ElyC/SanA/YdcF family protein [Marinomonas pollencensis]REG82612.1 uncharacterized SAM-binding protein YcdF (DUF218 family) [Marinomonas pollencensis]
MDISLFTLKKLIGMALMPIPLSLIFILLGLLFMASKPKTAKGLLVAAIALLGLTSFDPVANRLIAPLENSYPVFNTQQTVDVVVVLGSAHQTYPNDPAVMQLGRSAIYRLEEGLRILKANPDAQLFVSGFAGHAKIMHDAAIELGTKPSRIVMFPKPKDTEAEANAMASKLIGKRVALVSEASHLKRALGFFQQTGITAMPAPAFRLSDSRTEWRIGASENYKSQRAFYEYLGLAWQWLKAKMAG